MKLYINLYFIEIIKIELSELKKIENFLRLMLK